MPNRAQQNPRVITACFDGVGAETLAGRRRGRDRHTRAALDGISLGVATFDADLELHFVNSRLAAMLEIPDAAAACASNLPELLQASPVLCSATAEQVGDACLDVIASGRTHSSSIAPQPEREGSFSLTVIALDDGSWMATLQEAPQQTGADRADNDALTGLSSRTLFQDRVTAALAGLALDDNLVSRPSVMMVDLDRFKGVNDTLGHPVGDALLRLVAKRLRGLVRAEDVVARMGGDEFAVFVPVSAGVGPASIAQLAKRIVDLLGRPYLVDGHLINVGASVGVATALEHGNTYEQLMRNADLALYSAKSSGRATFSFFAWEMDARASARRLLEIDLRKALALRQFELHYQPQIDLSTNTVVGFEALVRWRHPVRGLVAPADFIPLAEDVGLIGALGEWVLREACLAAAQWPDRVSVAVNVSPHQFNDTTRLVQVVAQALAVAGLPGHRLEVEVTESALLRSEQAVIAALHGLRKMNVRVAMDDFGTGYSSLSQLHSFPFDKIKIDRSFIKDRGDASNQNAIIRAITALGVSLGMSTIAEGVETVDQLDRVRLEGCTSVQGYYFSRPVPGDQVSRFIADFPGTVAA